MSQVVNQAQALVSQRILTVAECQGSRRPVLLLSYCAGAVACGGEEVEHRAQSGAETVSGLRSACSLSSRAHGVSFAFFLKPNENRRQAVGAN
jgi:hypothetical protein